MNPNTPYNSGTLKNMVQKVRVYCAKVIPLVFDNTLSYYESLCACVAKVNELCDAVDAQNLTIVEFTHLVEVELDKLSKYIDEQVTALDARVTANEENIHTLAVRTDNQELVLQNLEEWREWASGQLSDIRDILATCLKQSDLTDTITDGDTTHVPTADAVYDAIQSATGVTVRDAQANPTHGIVKGIVTTDFQQLANPLSITNGVLSMREATKNVTGYVQIGDNINVTNGVISVPEGSTTAVGVVGLKQTGAIEKTIDGIDVKTGDYIYKKQNGALDVPLATNSQLGIVAPKLGGALDIQSSGEIDAKNATTTQKGVVTLTDTITDGDTTHVPTADAVYDAVQSASGTVPDATTTTKGKVQIGDNINVSSGVISVPDATQYTKGVVQASDNIEIANGAISVPDATQSKKGVVMLDAAVTQSSGNVPTSGAVYDAIQAASTTVPDATSDTKGKVKPGVGLEIAAATPGIMTLATATQNTLGGFKVTDTITDGDTTHVPTADAVYDAVQSASGTVPDATTTTKGKVQIGDNINVSSGVISVPDASALTKGVMTVGSGLSASQGLVYLAQASDSTIGGVKIGDGLKNDTDDKLTIDSDATLAIDQGGKLTVRTATPDNVGLATIDGTSSNLTLAYGKLDVPTGSRDTKGVLQVGSNINVGNGVISVPTATPGTLGVTTIADTGSNLTMGAGGVIDVPTAAVGTKGVMTLSQYQDELYLSGNGELGINAATENRKGVVQVGTNIDVTNGVISVPDATVGISGVVTKSNTVAYGSTAVPTSGAVYDYVASVLQNGGFSRTLQLEHNSNPDGGAECILVADSSLATNITPTSTNIVNATGVNNTRAEYNVTNTTKIHIFVKTSLYPSNLDYTSQALCTTLESKYSVTSTSPKFYNGFIPVGYHNYNNFLIQNVTISVGDTFTNSNGESYRHIIMTGVSDYTGLHEFRIKIDY